MRAYVVGGGPSALDFGWYEVRDWDLTVACHDAAHRMPFAPTVQLSVDRPYWQGNRPRLGSAGVWVVVDGRDSDRVPRQVLRIKCATVDHWDLDWSDDFGRGVMVGGCSGIAAVNYAVLRGATELHLVGIDLEGEGNPWDRWREGFAYAVRECEKRGVRVVPRGRWCP